MRSVPWLLWIVWMSLAPAGAQKLDAERIRQLERLIEEKRTEAKVPGLSAAVGFEGNLQWERGFGLADLENGVRTEAQTMFRTGSVAKPITAVALLSLVEEGKIDLDAEIQDYVPSFPKKRWPVTVRHLLGHLSGVRHYKGDETESVEHYVDLLTPFAIFKDDPLLFEPGTQYSYTTYGFNLLGAAVEHAAGESFLEAVRKRVLEPAGMWSTRDDDVLAVIPRRTRFYQVNAAGEIHNAGLVDVSNKIPGGGMLSTSGDLVRFALATRNGVLLEPKTVEEMWTAQTLRSGEKGQVGLGWFVAGEVRDLRASHGGGQQGTTAHLAILVDDGVAVAVMTNLEAFRGMRELVDGMLEIVRRP